ALPAPGGADALRLHWVRCVRRRRRSAVGPRGRVSRCQFSPVAGGIRRLTAGSPRSPWQEVGRRAPHERRGGRVPLLVPAARREEEWPWSLTFARASGDGRPTSRRSWSLSAPIPI